MSNKSKSIDPTKYSETNANEMILQLRTLACSFRLEVPTDGLGDYSMVDVQTILLREYPELTGAIADLLGVMGGDQARLTLKRLAKAHHESKHGWAIVNALEQPFVREYSDITFLLGLFDRSGNSRTREACIHGICARLNDYLFELEADHSKKPPISKVVLGRVRRLANNPPHDKRYVMRAFTELRGWLRKIDKTRSA